MAEQAELVGIAHASIEEHQCSSCGTPYRVINERGTGDLAGSRPATDAEVSEHVRFWDAYYDVHDSGATDQQAHAAACHLVHKRGEG